MKTKKKGALFLTMMLYALSQKEGQAYVVKPGETLSEIAREHKIPWQALQKENDLQNPHKIDAGQYLIEPEGWWHKDGEAYRVVRTTDTLSALSRKWNCSIADILRENPNIGDPDTIEFGQVIYIPRPGTAAPLEKKEKIVRETPGLEGIIRRVSGRLGMPKPEVVHAIALTENGKLDDHATRYEPAFQRRYVDPLFRFDKKGDLIRNGKNRKFVDLYNYLRKKDKDLTLEKFKRQLATSIGVCQIMYTTAIEQGYDGTFEGLSDRETNIYFAVKRILAHARATKLKLIPTGRDYNSGSVNGTAHPGYIERLKGHYGGVKDLYSDNNQKKLYKADGTEKDRGLISG